MLLPPENMADPKSHSLMAVRSSFTRMLSGLMSACRTPHVFRWWRARNIWVA